MKRKNTVTWESLDKDKWTIDKGQNGLYYCTHVSFNKKIEQILDQLQIKLRIYQIHWAIA